MKVIIEQRDVEFVRLALRKELKITASDELITKLISKTSVKDQLLESEPYLDKWTLQRAMVEILELMENNYPMRWPSDPVGYREKFFNDFAVAAQQGGFILEAGFET